MGLCGREGNVELRGVGDWRTYADAMPMARKMIALKDFIFGFEFEET
jgi:hypothetical protein